MDLHDYNQQWKHRQHKTQNFVQFFYILLVEEEEITKQNFLITEAICTMRYDHNISD